MKHTYALTFEMDLPGGSKRLRELILFVSKKCEGANRFGKVKLNKILWRADFTAFKARRMPVSGRSYQKLTAGPAPIEMPLLLEQMMTENLIKIESRDLGNSYQEDRIIALVEPNLRLFSQDDISFVDESIVFYWKKTATKASDLSHGVAWNSREYLDLMPYESVFFSDEKLSGPMLEKLKQLAQEKRWKSM